MYMAILKLKVARIGNSRGVRLPAASLKRYRIRDTVLMEERSDGILLRPAGPAVEKLSWEDTAREMAASGENWAEWDDQALNSSQRREDNPETETTQPRKGGQISRAAQDLTRDRYGAMQLHVSRELAQKHPEQLSHAQCWVKIVLPGSQLIICEPCMHVVVPVLTGGAQSPT